MKKHVENYVIVFCCSDSLTHSRGRRGRWDISCSLLRPSIPFFYCGNDPYLLSVPCRSPSPSSFFYPYRFATGHQLVTKSSSLRCLRFRTVSLPSKRRFYSRTEGYLYIKKIIMGDGMEESNYGRKYITYIGRRHRFKTLQCRRGMK